MKPHENCDLWRVCSIAGVVVFIDRSHGEQFPYVCGNCFKEIPSSAMAPDMMRMCASHKTLAEAPAKKPGSKRFFEKS